mmetsp:Transcript_8889/g.22784  ORF Transcript_8889/g.22784 Transcript_8889/m.22784 type:complete len:372 (-) Transcript_8889:276-1391(-)
MAPAALPLPLSQGGCMRHARGGHPLGAVADIPARPGACRRLSLPSGVLHCATPRARAQARNVSPVKSVPEKHASSSSVGQAGREAREPYLQAPETSPGRTTPDDAVQENSGMRPSAPTPPEDPELAEALTTREKLLRQVITMDGSGDGSQLKVEALRPEWVAQTQDILTSAFSDAMGYLPAYNRLLQNQIGSYLKEHMQLPPLAVVLMAVLEAPPSEADSALQEGGQIADSRRGSNNGAVPVGQDDGGMEAAEQRGGGSVAATLIGTLELSFRPATRSAHMTLNPPTKCAYLCNMAIDPSYRRQGFGTKLLDAAETFVGLAGEDEIYLHVRLADEDAQALYLSAGYEILETDMWIARLFGVERRHLMRKKL